MECPGGGGGGGGPTGDAAGGTHSVPSTRYRGYSAPGPGPPADAGYTPSARMAGLLAPCQGPQSPPMRLEQVCTSTSAPPPPPTLPRVHVPPGGSTRVRSWAVQASEYKLASTGLGPRNQARLGRWPPLQAQRPPLHAPPLAPPPVLTPPGMADGPDDDLFDEQAEEAETGEEEEAPDAEDAPEDGDPPQEQEEEEDGEGEADPAPIDGEQRAAKWQRGDDEDDQVPGACLQTRV